MINKNSRFIIIFQVFPSTLPRDWHNFDNAANNAPPDNIHNISTLPLRSKSKHISQPFSLPSINNLSTYANEAFLEDDDLSEGIIYLFYTVNY